MRLFVGVALPEPLRAQLREPIASLHCRALLPKSARVLHEDTWHATLQFLGTVDDTAVPELARACSVALAEHASFDLQLGAAGAFPSARRARAIWCGLSAGASELAALAAAVQRATAPLGFTPEERAFQAHVTWARAKPEADARALLDAMNSAPRSQLRARVREVTLFRSHLSSQGARYEALQHLALRDARST